MAKKEKQFYNDIIVGISNSTHGVSHEAYVTLPGHENVRVPLPDGSSNGMKHITRIQIAAIHALHQCGWKDSQIAAALRITLNVASFHVALYENPRAEWKSIVEWKNATMTRNDAKRGLEDTEGQI